MVADKTRAVLIVEDEPLIRLDLAERLRADGYQIFQAFHAAHAIEILEAHADIRVVLTDIRMPGTMDGMALAHCVRKRWPPTIIIVMSAHKVPGEHEMPSKSHFLPKPFAPQDLNKIMQKVESQLDDNA
jgi:DNA-binding NtrC family response regulator